MRGDPMSPGIIDTEPLREGQAAQGERPADEPLSVTLLRSISVRPRPPMGAADFAGGMGQDLPTNRKGRRLAQPGPRPTAFNDLAGLVEDPLGEEETQAEADQGVPGLEIERED